MLGKRELKLAIVGFGALAVSGCGVAFKDELGGEQVSKKKVAVSFTLCKEDEGACDTWSQSGTDYRLLIGFRVPKGTKPPQEFSSSSGLPVQLTRNSSYKRELNAKAPKGKKYKWFGYLSDVLELDADDDASFAVRMKLPRDFKPKRFRVRPVAGFTEAETTEIDCGNDPFDPGEGGGEPNSFCIYAPREDEIGENLKIKVSKRKG